jgi:hypothetical protein
MAARLLKKTEHGKEEIATREDNLESFFHVLLWVALRYTAHTQSTEKLSDMLFLYFEHSFVDANGVA